MPIEVAIQDVKQSIHSNATITSSGSTVLNGYGSQQVSLIVNIKAAPTGTNPTIKFTIQEVDPGDGATLIGNTASTAVITAAGTAIATINTTTSGTFLISWTVTGTTPSFTQVYSTFCGKTTPTTQTVSSSVSTTISGFALGTVTVSSSAVTAIRASTYNEQSSNAQRSISSASSSDTSAGTGARQVQITYLTSTGTGPFTETITLNGTTAVNTVNSNICFIESIKVAAAGSGGSNVGALTLFVSTAGGGGTLAVINAGDNQDLWAHHHVATGYTCNVTGVSGHNSNASNGSVLSLRSKSIPVATAPELVISDFVHVGGSSTAQATRSYSTPLKVIGPARLLLYSQNDGTPTITTRASFDFYDQ